MGASSQQHCTLKRQMSWPDGPICTSGSYPTEGGHRALTYDFTFTFLSHVAMSLETTGKLFSDVFDYHKRELCCQSFFVVNASLPKSLACGTLIIRCARCRVRVCVLPSARPKLQCRFPHKHIILFPKLSSGFSGCGSRGPPARPR